MRYQDFRRKNTSTNILNEDEGPSTREPISRVKSTQPQGKVRVVPYDASKAKAKDKSSEVPVPKETRYKTPLTSQGKVRVVPDKSTPAPAPKAAAPATKVAMSTPAPKAAMSAPAPKAATLKPKPSGETDASRAARQAAYNDWKKTNAEPMAKLASETSGKAGYQGFKKGGGIDGVAKSGKTRGKFV